MPRLVIELRKTIVIDTENVNDQDALGVANWFGMSGAMVDSLKFNGDEVAAGTELGQSYAPATVVEVFKETFVSIGGGMVPAGRDWKPYPVRVWPPCG